MILESTMHEFLAGLTAYVDLTGLQNIPDYFRYNEIPCHSQRHADTSHDRSPPVLSKVESSFLYPKSNKFQKLQFSPYRINQSFQLTPQPAPKFPLPALLNPAFRWW